MLAQITSLYCAPLYLCYNEAMMGKGHLKAMVLLLVLAAPLLLWNAHRGSLLGSDDCIYAQVAREALRHKDPLDLTYLGNPFFDKGPGLPWSLYLTISLFGENELALRLPGILFALLLLLAALAVSASLGAGPWPSFIGAFSLLASNVFYFNSRRPMTDIPSVALAALGVFYLIRPRLRPFTGGLLLGASGLFKLAPPLLTLASLALLQLDPRWRLSPAHFTKLLLGLFSILLPWHLYMTFVYGSDFWRTYLGYHVFERASKAIVGNPDEPVYLAWLIEREGVLSLLVLLAFLKVCIDALRGEGAARLALSFWAPALLALLFSATALPHYLCFCLFPSALSLAHLAKQAVLSFRRPLLLEVGSLALIAMTFVANNASDLLSPDYGSDTKEACAWLKEKSALAGTFEVHDTCVAWYCDVKPTFFALDQGFLGATEDVPVLQGVVAPLRPFELLQLAREGRILLTRPDRLPSLMAFASTHRVYVRKEWTFGGRILARLGLEDGEEVTGQTQR